MTARWVDVVATALARRTSRRGFLARTAVVGAAVAMDPVNYVLRPASAYSSVCGDGASCSSGWTAFCVTVNNGVNQCPPGSYAAGWWKADNASVCGGHARYYVDCNASCVHGRSGHYTCSCRCAHTTTCDKRRTCCNQFRYGQCNQQIGCYGPVVCRVVSCVPPWSWANCSHSAATDNRTLSHTAPDLPHHYDAVERRYVGLHGHDSPLGASVGGRHPVAAGLLQHYQHGLLTWSTHTPAAMLLACAAGYLHAGGPTGVLGFPTRDERRTADAHAYLAHCAGGYVYAGGGRSVHAPSGPWLSRWVALADDMAVAGRPASHLFSVSGGHVGVFDRGCLAWSAATGVHLVSGPSFTRYVDLGREHSALGFPTADTRPLPGGSGSWTPFHGGAIVSSPSAGTWDVTGAVYRYWRDSGGVTSPLGLPTSTVVAAAAGPQTQVAHFVDGDVYTSELTGTFAVTPPILAGYADSGGCSGPLGLPVADATSSAATTTQQFERGTISCDAATGQTSVDPAPTSPS